MNDKSEKSSNVGPFPYEDIPDVEITSLGDFENVGGQWSPGSSTPIESLGNLESVGGELNLEELRKKD